MKHKELMIDKVWCGDEPQTVAQLEQIVREIKHKYGSNAVVSFDGGYNNVTVWVKPSRKPR